MASATYLSPSEILDIIGEYSKTSEGKSEIKKHLKTKKFYLGYRDKNKNRTTSQMKRDAEKAADILYQHMIEDTKEIRKSSTGVSYETVGLSELNRNDIIVGAPYDISDLGTQIDISFNPDVMKRKSLYEEKYNGINDIFALFVHGYSGAKNSVHGEWKGVHIMTKRSREPNDFLINAVNDINAMLGKRATATIKPKYRR